jgi:hypothetical protein
MTRIAQWILIKFLIEVYAKSCQENMLQSVSGQNNHTLHNITKENFIKHNIHI